MTVEQQFAAVTGELQALEPADVAGYARALASDPAKAEIARSIVFEATRERNDFDNALTALAVLWETHDIRDVLSWLDDLVKVSGDLAPTWNALRTGVPRGYREQIDARFAVPAPAR